MRVRARDGMIREEESDRYCRVYWRRPLCRFVWAVFPDDPPPTRWEAFLGRHPQVAGLLDYLKVLYR